MVMINVDERDNSKQELAYEKIKEAIIRNELLPDTLLVERNLCSALGFSRTPVREALRRLAGEGLVESIPDKGMFVTRIRFEDLIEIYEMKEILEGMAVRLFTQRKTDESVRLLEENLDIQEKAIQEMKYELVIEKDLEFHQLYTNGSKNSRLISFTNTIRNQYSRAAYYTVHDIDRIKLSLTQHRKVLDAIREGDANLAETLVKEHILSVKRYHLRSQYLTK